MKMDLAPPPPQQMMGLITGYWRSQAVGVAARMAIADRLGDGAKTVAALAGETAVDEAVRTGVRTAPAALGCEIFEWYGKHPVEGAAFSGAMGNLSALAAQEAGRLLSLPEKATVVDVGGAHGTLIAGVLKANPAARGVLTDLPHVIADAPKALASLGMAGRVEAVAGDFFQAVPEGDVYLLKQVLHDWNDEQCVALFQAAGLSAAKVTPTHSPFSLVEATRA